jgi:hypothetical protein
MFKIKLLLLRLNPNKKVIEHGCVFFVLKLRIQGMQKCPFRSKKHANRWLPILSLTFIAAHVYTSDSVNAPPIPHLSSAFRGRADARQDLEREAGRVAELRDDVLHRRILRAPERVGGKK